MDNDLWLDEPQVESPQVVNALPSVQRVWLERITIGVIAVISISVPLIIGLLFFLALTDGLVINANDPFRESRLWMVQERAGATGIGLSVTMPRESTATTQCAVTSVTFLKWDRRLRLESDASYCRCFVTRNGQLLESSSVTCKP